MSLDHMTEMTEMTEMTDLPLTDKDFGAVAASRAASAGKCPIDHAALFQKKTAQAAEPDSMSLATCCNKAGASSRCVRAA